MIFTNRVAKKLTLCRVVEAQDLARTAICKLNVGRVGQIGTGSICLQIEPSAQLARLTGDRSGACEISGRVNEYLDVDISGIEVGALDLEQRFRGDPTRRAGHVVCMA